MTERFENAATARLRAPSGEVTAMVAAGFRLRLLGLMYLEADDVEPLLIPGCSSIHTFGMRTPIDLVWLQVTGSESRVLGVVDGLAPGRWARAPRGGARRATAALELAPGDAKRLGLAAGAHLTVE